MASTIDINNSTNFEELAEKYVFYFEYAFGVCIYLIFMIDDFIAFFYSDVSFHKKKTILFYIMLHFEIICICAPQYTWNAECEFERERELDWIEFHILCVQKMSRLRCMIQTENIFFSSSFSSFYWSSISHCWLNQLNVRWE